MDEPPSNSKQDYGWFRRFIINILQRYAHQASADRIFKKYAGLPKDVIAARYIAVQARVALLAGAVSALIVSTAQLVSGAAALGEVALPVIATPVAVSTLLITVPTMLIVFGGEMAFTVRLQVRTAYDLCLLYGVLLDPDDPEDLWDIFLIGLGAKGGESVTHAIHQLMPKITAQQARKLLRGGLIRRRLQDWAAKNLSREFARRYLAEGFLLKLTVPGVSIFLGAGWNYFTTVGIGRAVQGRTRGRGLSSECIDQLEIADKAAPELVLATALNVISLDTRISENELTAYKRLGARLQEIHSGFDPQNLVGHWAEQGYWLSKVATVQDTDVQSTILSVFETMATLDGRIERAEIKLWKQLAKLLGIEIDKSRLKKLKERTKIFYMRPRGLACRIVALMIGIGILLLSCACFVTVILLAKGAIGQ